MWDMVPYQITVTKHQRVRARKKNNKSSIKLIQFMRMQFDRYINEPEVTLQQELSDYLNRRKTNDN